MTFHNSKAQMNPLTALCKVIVYLSSYELDHIQCKFYIRVSIVYDDYCLLIFMCPSINC